MGRPGDYHAEWGGSGRERQVSHDVAYVWNIKKMMQVHITLQEVKCDLGEFLTHQNTRFCKFYKNTVPCEHIASAFSEVRQRPARMMDPEACSSSTSANLPLLSLPSAH